MKRLVLFVPLLLAVVLATILFWGIGKDPTKLESARINDPLPAFTLPALQQRDRMLSVEDLKGEPALLNVWATWCPSCRTEHHYLNDIAKTGKVKIFGLNYKDDRQAAQKWLTDLGNPYQFNIYDVKGTLGFDLGVYGAPETYVLDKNGIVRYRHVGVVDDRVWQETLAPMIEKLRL